MPERTGGRATRIRTRERTEGDGLLFVTALLAVLGVLWAVGFVYLLVWSVMR